MVLSVLLSSLGKRTGLAEYFPLRACLPIPLATWYTGPGEMVSSYLSAAAPTRRFDLVNDIDGRVSFMEWGCRPTESGRV